MRYLTQKDISKRELSNSREISRLYLKGMLHNLNIDRAFRNAAMVKLLSLPRDSNFIRIKNRCTLTGSAKSVSRKFRLSRMYLKEYAVNGKLAGVTRSTW